MKTLAPILLALALSSNLFAAQDVNKNLGYKTKQKIIEKLIESDVAQKDYFGGTSEASVSEVISRDYSDDLSGVTYKNYTKKVYLDCNKTAKKNVLRCKVVSHDQSQDPDGGPVLESAVWIEGDVQFNELSTEILISNVQVNLAG